MKIYETDPGAHHLLRAFMALALLPVNLIREAFELLKEKVIHSSYAGQLHSFVLYLENEWLNHFNPSTWSVSASNWRTNNFVEVKNNTLRQLL